jgi:type IV pilus assembly protein PilV
MNAPIITRTHQGFSLIEVLIALVVLAIGLLGLATLQMTSLQFNSDAYLRSQATVMAYDIMDRMRTNMTGVVAGNYTVATESDANAKVSSYSSCSGSSCGCTGTTTCSVANMALYDLGTWYDRMDKTLPGSSSKRATIEDLGNREFRITIKWDERDLQKNQAWVIQL